MMVVVTCGGGGPASFSPLPPFLELGTVGETGFELWVAETNADARGT